ncbi:hypothetical protein GBAR_LOCUS13314 [Geodia barretti]|uniref:Uncharacterized protein n=1 Tax=Geodia barretti TaxID=519541 RepID=A0AA35S3C6_GEOBA|nr:hypothetical protein GBAR_LOCUS13314 [Geodia barretti]
MKGTEKELVVEEVTTRDYLLPKTEKFRRLAVYYS